MTRFVAVRRLLGTVALLAAVAVPAILLGPRVVRAFTLPPDVIFFDPISVPVDHTLRVHLVNELGAGHMIFRPFVQPTTPGYGRSVAGAAVSLGPGIGAELGFTFARFAPPAGVTRVPVVCTILVSAASGRLPSDWSGTVASSVEIVDDTTGAPTAILGGRHITRWGRGGAPTPCLFCN